MLLLLLLLLILMTVIIIIIIIEAKVSASSSANVSLLIEFGHVVLSVQHVASTILDIIFVQFIFNIENLLRQFIVIDV